MKTTANTILITGGSAGIGLEIARKFVALGNKVIITGRDETRLSKAAAELGNVIAIPFDVSKNSNVEALANLVKNEYPDLNVLINNAGYAKIHNLSDANGNYDIAAAEMDTNFLSVVRLTEKLLPILRTQKKLQLLMYHLLQPLFQRQSCLPIQRAKRHCTPTRNHLGLP